MYVLIVIFSVLLLASVGGFFAYTKFKQVAGFTNEHVSLKIEPPISIVSGKEDTYTVMITNGEKVNLYNAKLELTYPNGFQFVSSDPVALTESKNNWEFPVLRTGETQKIQIKGKIVSAINSSLTFKGTLDFKPSDINAFYKQDVIVDAQVVSSMLDLTFSGPETTLADKKNDYSIKYKNNGTDDLVDLQLILEYPVGFVFYSSDPASDKDNHGIWTIAKIKSGASGEIKIKGDFSQTNNGGNLEMKARMQLKRDGDYYPQAERSMITNVIKDQLSMQIFVNGSGTDQPIDFGSLMVYTINYKNSGQESLNNLKIKAVLDSSIIDWNSLQDQNKGLIEQNAVTWTGKEISKLLRLAPGEEGEITFSIRVADFKAIADKNIAKYSIESYSEAVADPSSSSADGTTVRSNTIVNEVNSDLALQVQARYYNEDNIPLGSGPIAPKVGEKSSYNINIEVSNNLHDVKDLMLVATLPSNVSWDNVENHTAGNVVFNDQAHKVTWSASRLTKSANSNSLIFNVSISPKESDMGRILILLSEINLTAKDADTGADISKSLRAITTSFNDPILGQVSGLVE